MDVEFLFEVFAMLLNGFNADAEFRRDFLVGVAFGDQLEDCHLAQSQLCVLPMEFASAE